MGISTTTTTAGLTIQKFIGSAYDNVKLVADNIDALILLSQNIGILIDGVDNTELADMAQNTIKGRITAGTGDPEDLTAAQIRSIINVENGATADQSAAEIKTAYESLVGIVSQVDAEEGTLQTVFRWTPERVKQAILALAPATAGSTLSQVKLSGYTEITQSPAPVTNVVTMVYTNSNVLDLTGVNELTAGTTINFDFTGVPANEAVSISVYVEQDAIGGHAITWDAAVDFGDNVPTQVTAANAQEMYVFSRPNSTFPLTGGRAWSKTP